jgi:hypothetical protein
MASETALLHSHGESRLSQVEGLGKPEAALTIFGRVYGADDAFLQRHRELYEAVLDWHRDQRVQILLVQGRTREARREVARLHHLRRGIYRLSYLPGWLVRSLLALRRLLRTRGQMRSSHASFQNRKQERWHPA